MTGSISPKFFKISVRSLYSIWSNGMLSINIGWMNDNERTIGIRNDFLSALEKIKELEIPESSQKLNFVNISVDKWCLVVDDFIRTVQNLINK